MGLLAEAQLAGLGHLLHLLRKDLHGLRIKLGQILPKLGISADALEAASGKVQRVVGEDGEVDARRGHRGLAIGPAG